MSANTIQRQRLEQRFELWDANGDGQVDKSDYEAEARRILSSFSEAETTTKGKAVLDAYRNMWTIAAKSGGIAETGALNPEQFNAASEKSMLDRGEQGFAEVLRPCIAAVANLADEDDDGEVDRDEFARWLNAIGVPNDPAQLFERLDSNKSGTLTTDELVQAVRDYHEGKLDVPLLGR
ncbi:MULTISPECIES: EF-hand domain-containing protein [Actinoplanes]|uniref:EF-hand domain-containing protein n=1 Tax=Actinoplanes TaxID=1865 RepID=UPI0005F2E361|nr:MULTISPECIES: EF-hand domain-containing protein [Actinoplanes]GLY05394.1 hypothetical protein Acsp01_57730 [Actinoplanes sp. NBRC 101535]